MKKTYLLLAFLAALLGFIGCNDDDDNLYINSKVTIQNSTESYTIAAGDTLFLKADIQTIYDYTIEWRVNGTAVSDSIILPFVAENAGDYSVTLVAAIQGKIYEEKQTVHVTKKEVSHPFSNGTFVLNEGNMTTGSGFVNFIDDKGVITDSIYYKANGTFLGNVTQDMFIKDGNIYFISQNGAREENQDGTLVIADATTMKKIAAFNTELSELSWATHLAVTGQEDVYIRDGNGIHHFNPSTKELTSVSGTERAIKNRMVVANKKIFAAKGMDIVVIEGGAKTVSQTISMNAMIIGLVRCDDGNVMVACNGDGAKFVKINSGDGSIMKTNELTEGNLSSYSNPAMDIKGDTIYFTRGWSKDAFKIHRHLFSTGVTETIYDMNTLVPDHNVPYNGLGVHPKTGEVYFNTIKDWGADYIYNQISILNFSATKPVVKAQFKNHTAFPAGFYFTANFN